MPRPLVALTLIAATGALVALPACGDDEEKTVTERETVTAPTSTRSGTTERSEPTATASTETTPSGPTDCGNVTVELGNESEGGANSVEASGVDCSAALEAARQCVRGDVPSGYSVSGELGSPKLTSGERSVSFTLVGGGGCQPLD